MLKKWLNIYLTHKSVAWVSHASAPDHPDHELAKKLLPNGVGSMIAFGIKGGKEAGEAFINNVNLLLILQMLETLELWLFIQHLQLIHKWMKLHLKFAGLSHDMIRLSVGH